MDTSLERIRAKAEMDAKIADLRIAEKALRAHRALDTAQAVSGGGLTIPAEPAAGQGSTDT